MLDKNFNNSVNLQKWALVPHYLDVMAFWSSYKKFLVYNIVHKKAGDLEMRPTLIELQSLDIDGPKGRSQS